MLNYYFCVGYRSEKGNGGIRSFCYSEEKNEIVPLPSHWEGFAPSYMAISRGRKHIAAAAETINGGVFVILQRDALNEPFQLSAMEELSKTDRFSHCSFSRDDRFILATNYMSGSVQSYQIDNKASRVIPADRKSQMGFGHGPNAERQESSHPHSAFQSDASGFIAVSDLGADILCIYQMDDSGKLALINQWKAEAGSGPRHTAFSHDGKRCYLLTELSSCIHGFHVDDGGNLAEICRISALQPEYQGYSLASEIRISANGKYLYAANRGGNTIAHFCIEEDGCLTNPRFVSTRGWPREFALTDDGRYMLVLDEEFADSKGELEVFAIDGQNGALKTTDAWIPLPGAYTLEFAYAV